MQLLYAIGCVVTIVSCAKLPELDYADWKPIPGPCLSCEEGRRSFIGNSRAKKSFDEEINLEGRQLDSFQDEDKEIFQRHAVFAAESPDINKVQLVYVPEGSLNDLQSIQLLRVGNQISNRRSTRSVIFPDHGVFKASPSAFSLRHVSPKRPTALITQQAKLSEAHQHVELLEAALSSHSGPVDDGELPRVFIAPTNLEPPPGYVKIPLISTEKQMKSKKVLPGTFLTSEIHNELPPGFVQVPLPERIAELSHSIPFVNPNLNSHFTGNNHNINENIRQQENVVQNIRNPTDHFKIRQHANPKFPGRFQVNQDVGNFPSSHSNQPEFSNFNDFGGFENNNQEFSHVQHSQFPNTGSRDVVSNTHENTVQGVEDNVRDRFPEFSSHGSSDNHFNNQGFNRDQQSQQVVSHQVFNIEHGRNTEERPLPDHSQSVNSIPNHFRQSTRVRITDDHSQNDVPHRNIRIKQPPFPESNDFRIQNQNEHSNSFVNQRERGSIHSNVRKPVRQEFEDTQTNIFDSEHNEENLDFHQQTVPQTESRRPITHIKINQNTATGFSNHRFNTRGKSQNSRPQQIEENNLSDDSQNPSLIPIPVGKFDFNNFESSGANLETGVPQIRPRPVSGFNTNEEIKPVVVENVRLNNFNNINEENTHDFGTQVVPGLKTRIITDFDNTQNTHRFNNNPSTTSNRQEVNLNQQTENKITNDHFNIRRPHKILPKPIENIENTVQKETIDNLREFEPVTEKPIEEEIITTSVIKQQRPRVNQRVRTGSRPQTSRGRVRFRGSNRQNIQGDKKTSRTRAKITSNTNSENTVQTFRTRAQLANRRRRPVPTAAVTEATPTTTTTTERIESATKKQEASTLFPPFSVAKRIRDGGQNNVQGSNQRNGSKRKDSSLLRGRFGSRLRSKIQEMGEKSGNSNITSVPVRNPNNPQGRIPVRRRRIRVRGRKRNPSAIRQQRVLNSVKRIKTPLANNNLENTEDFALAESARVSVSEAPLPVINDIVDKTLDLINNKSLNSQEKEVSGTADNVHETQFKGTAASPTTSKSAITTEEETTKSPIEETTTLESEGTDASETILTDSESNRYVNEKFLASDRSTNSPPLSSVSFVEFRSTNEHDNKFPDFALSPKPTHRLVPSSYAEETTLTTTPQTLHDNDLHDDRLGGTYDPLVVTDYDDYIEYENVDNHSWFENNFNDSFISFNNFLTENSTDPSFDEEQFGSNKGSATNETFLGSSAQIIYAVALADLPNARELNQTTSTDLNIDNSPFNEFPNVQINSNIPEDFIINRSESKLFVDELNLETTVKTIVEIEDTQDRILLESESEAEETVDTDSDANITSTKIQSEIKDLDSNTNISSDLRSEIDVNNIDNDTFVPQHDSQQTLDEENTTTQKSELNKELPKIVDNIAIDAKNKLTEDLFGTTEIPEINLNITESQVKFDMESLQNLTSQYFSSLNTNESLDIVEDTVTDTTTIDTTDPSNEIETATLLNNDLPEVDTTINEHTTEDFETTTQFPTEDYESETNTVANEKRGKSLVLNNDIFSMDNKEETIQNKVTESSLNIEEETPTTKIIGESTVTEIRSSAPVVCIGNRCVIATNLRKRRNS